MSETKDPIKLAEELEKQIYGDLEQMLKASEAETKKEQTELSPAVLEILKSAKEEFYRDMKKKAEAMEGWAKYKPEQQKTLLEIETETFLRDFIGEEFVSRGLVAKESVEKAVEMLMSEKTIEDREEAMAKSGSFAPPEISEPAAGESIEEKVNGDEAVGPAKSSENKTMTLDEYKEMFKNKSDEELAVLDKEIGSKIDAMPEERRRGGGAYGLNPSPEFSDLINQGKAVEEIKRQRQEVDVLLGRFEGETKKTEPEIVPKTPVAARETEPIKEKVEQDAAGEKFVVPEEFERKEYDEIKKAHDGISKLLVSKGINPEKYYFNYKAVFKLAPDSEKPDEKTGVLEMFENYHDYLKRLQNLTDEEKNQINTFWTSRLWGEWSSPAVFTNFYKDMDNSDSELYSYREELQKIIDAQRDGRAPDLYAEAVKKGEVKRIES